MQVIHETLQNTRLGEPQTIHNLTMTPLLRDKPRSADYLTLDEALAMGLARVTEVSDQGSVPELMFTNETDSPILLLDGEELVGAKQNRILNITVFAPAKQKLVIPVSCVEAGRWAHRSPEFHSAGRTMYAEGRARKMAHVSESLLTSRAYRSRQGEVWEDIALKSHRMGSRSPTGAMEAMYEDNVHSLRDYTDALHGVRNQVGAIFEVAGGTVGLELFDSDATLNKLLAKIATSYALDAIDSHGRPAASRNDRARLLHELMQADGRTYPALGHGEDIRLHGPNVLGSALVHDNRVVHLCAFMITADERQADLEAGGMLSARQRRMMRR